MPLNFSEFDELFYAHMHFYNAVAVLKPYVNLQNCFYKRYLIIVRRAFLSL